ncbi:unnamed protein product [Cyclocybe aegerita]|uniref:Retrovirus-related Pol polyprotein from transposon TNT 1-94-like beta-barrel domain-containing protein n=1 Tax=Cyclocybe aegerita TaxID=1973307 RepID=A0A8S0Y032_CYCAE|nr:unnamed protein product [Cyclocybe aegerita]
MKSLHQALCSLTPTATSSAELLKQLHECRCPEDPSPEHQAERLLNQLTYQDFPALRRAKAKLTVASCLPTDTGAEPYTSFAGAVIEASDILKPQCELYDSGASCHMTPFCNQLINYVPIDAQPITAADKQVFHAVGKGDLQICIPNGKTTMVMLLRNVLYAPSMGLTIVSISCIAAAGYAALFWSNFCRIFDPKDCRIAHIHITPNGFYHVEHREVVSSASMTTITAEDPHCRMGHILHDMAWKLVKQGLVTGVVLEGDDRRMHTCESCEYAKATRKRVRKEQEEPCADLWGLAHTKMIHKKQYYVSFSDDATRYTCLSLLRHKDEAFDTY